MSSLSLLILLILHSFTSSHCNAINFSQTGHRFDGIGALSGGGGVTRLLIDYPSDVQEEIYDILFTPNRGASLQFIKIEIGGEMRV